MTMQKRVELEQAIIELLKEIDEGQDQLAKVLADMLNNTTLTSLNLGDNQIGDRGAEALANALQCNTTLTSLNLRFNDIGDIGAEALAKALQCNTTLTYLDLRFNDIGDIGAEALAKALQYNTTLICDVQF